MPLSSELLPGVPLVESPLFAQSLDHMELTAEERAIAIQLNERGYAVFDFPDEEIDARIQRIKATLSPRYTVDFSDLDSTKNLGDMRIQDAWKFDEDVRAIASNPSILALLSKLYGRQAFPFQTLNFPVGTQQHMHSDSVHFSSIPERFMCGVWLAMEDISADAGPLLYYPGSHKWPILTNEMLGRAIDCGTGAQEPYEPVWRALVEANNIQPETFCARKGQALIWAANLLHGGSSQNDLKLTRWSQVTHYYFENCSYYTPAYSVASFGRLHLRNIQDINSKRSVENVYIDVPLGRRGSNKVRSASKLRKFLRRFGSEWHPRASSNHSLPSDFDAERYYALNPDVAETGQDARKHYLNHGKFEQRRYR